MSDNEAVQISPALADEIEEAILLGRPGELEAIIDNIADDHSFPLELRQSLQSLHYFRAHYGSVPLNDTDRKKATLMDSAWAMELLNKIRTRIEAVVKRA